VCVACNVDKKTFFCVACDTFLACITLCPYELYDIYIWMIILCVSCDSFLACITLCRYELYDIYIWMIILSIYLFHMFMK
jgi:hypothetical protein